MELFKLQKLRALRGLGIAGAFFCFFYLYTWLVVQPRLIYHSFADRPDFPVFFTGWEFLKKFLLYPAGPVEYVSAFLSQAFYLGWLGALVTTLVAVLLYSGTKRLLNLVGRKEWNVVALLPAIGLLAAYNRYHHPLGVFLGLSLALWAAVWYGRQAYRTAPARVVIFAGLFAVLYYAAGGGGFFFVVLAASLEACRRRGAILSGAYLLLAPAAIWLFSTHLYPLQINDASLRLTPFYSVLGRPVPVNLVVVIVCGLYVLLPALVLVLSLRRLAATETNADRKTPDAEQISTVKRLRIGLTRIGNTVGYQTVILVLIIAAGLGFSFDRARRNKCRLLYLYEQKKWNRLLDCVQNEQTRRYDPHVSCMTNLALYHTGRLGSEMFAYPQKGNSLFLSLSVPTDLRRWLDSGVLMELGAHNLAHKQTCECLENIGYFGPVLRRLAEIHLARGQPETARVHLRVLSKDLVHGDFARRMLRQLNSRDGYEKDDVKTASSQTDLPDRIIAGALVERTLLNLLEQDAQNRMAFEYLMSYYMLISDLEKLAANIRRLDNFDYEQVPVHYQEALLLHSYRKGAMRGLSQRYVYFDTIERFKRFLAVFNRVKNPRVAYDLLRPELGGSYFLYYLQNRGPKDDNKQTAP